GFFSPNPRSVVDTFSALMAASVRETLARTPYDLMVMSQLGTASYAPERTRVPKILEEVETSVIRELYTRARSPRARVRYGLTWFKMRAYVQRVVRRFDACTVVSERERDTLQRLVDTPRSITLIPNGVDTDSLRPCSEKPA